MKRTKAGKQKPTPPGTVIDRRGVTLSAGVAAFDEALVQRFKRPTDAEQIKSEAFGEEGPVVGPDFEDFPSGLPQNRRAGSSSEA
jgi:hypothetical protein